MSTTISFSRRTAAQSRISRTTIAMATAAIATVLTIIGAAIGYDPLTYISATIGLTSLYCIGRKGGDR